MKKILILVVLFFYSTSINCQCLEIKISKNKYDYVISDKLTNIHIHFTIKNLCSENMVLVLDTTEIGQYYEEKEYLFEVNAEKTGIQQNVFSPRTIFYEAGNSKPMFFDKIHGISSNYIDVKEAAKDQLCEIERHVQKVRNYSKIYFPRKAFYFADRAMYINNNLIFLEPNESKKMEITFDPMRYTTGGSYGFLLKQNKNYNFYLKIHNEKKTIMKYLTKENLEKIKNTKSKFLKKDIYSEKLILNTH